MGPPFDPRRGGPGRCHNYFGEEAWETKRISFEGLFEEKEQLSKTFFGGIVFYMELGFRA